MAYEIVWTENAKKDLELIYDYLVRKWSERVAEKFLVKVLARLELIETFPFSGRASYKDTSIHKLLITKHNSFYYKIDENTITILNIFDNRKELNPFD